MIKLTLNILIAEDNQFTALQYNRILEKFGHKVVITNDGDECLKKYNDEKKANDDDHHDNDFFNSFSVKMMTLID